MQRQVSRSLNAVALPVGGDSLYAPPGIAKPATVERQMSRAIADKFRDRTIVDVTPHIRKLRLVKDEFEIVALREAAMISAKEMLRLACSMVRHNG